MNLSVKGALTPAYYRGLSSLSLPLRRKLLYALHHKKIPDFKNPQTFSEKVNWRILFDRRRLLVGTCDKLEMKNYAQRVCGDLIRVPRTYWSGTDVGELEGIDLPDRWVLKPSHRSGSKVIFGQGNANIADLEQRTVGWLDELNWSIYGEWAYGQATPQFLVEEMIGRPSEAPRDYKFYVFHGEPFMVLVASDRFSDHTVRYYRPDWKSMNVSTVHPLGEEIPPPGNLDTMLKAAAALGEGFDFVRIDLYEADGEVWFGETSPYPNGGLAPFEPRSFDRELGDMWILPEL
ncbi:hypothetical protein A6F55_15555 [Prescottella equi]|uniref:ATP-grasp fold amidoligase family protein n=1 Tax=Rhodococcus hoagii TaxID=43767 RepID=UPI000A1085DF|nr:ATP-grasp fold amidoligase family protein [Prescottella equi]ORL02466.1 hypothetical protein A6F55_15555 [Prescottella equi]